jgi:hypothetical protein
MGRQIHPHVTSTPCTDHPKEHDDEQQRPSLQQLETGTKEPLQEQEQQEQRSTHALESGNPSLEQAPAQSDPSTSEAVAAAVASTDGSSDGKAKARSTSFIQMPSFLQQPPLESGGGGHKKKRRKKNKNMSIIKRLMRISISVSVVWLLLASINVYTWAYFRRHGEVKELRSLLLLRLVLLRCVACAT